MKRLHRAVVAALAEDAVEMPVHGERVRRHLLRRAGVPVADDLGDVELVAEALDHLAEAVMAVAVDRVARQAAHFEDVARRLAHLRRQELGRHAAHLLLVLVDLHHLVGVEHVVEGTRTTLFLSARRMMRSKPSGATALTMIAS